MSLSALTTLLSLPFARQVLAFEAVPLGACRAVYGGRLPYADTGSAGYVRWALDSIERLLDIPHERVLDDALMHLALHVGEAPSSLNALETQEDLRRLCAGLGLTPPTGKEAVKIFLLGLLEDMASGTIPAEQQQAALSCMHNLLGYEDYGEAFNRLSLYYWELERHDDLSTIGLTEGLPNRQELVRAFHACAHSLAAGLEVKPEPQGDGRYCLRVQPR